MTKVFSVTLVTGAIFAIAFFGGRQAAFSTNNHSSVAAAAPANLQALDGTWKLELGGQTMKTYRLSVSGERFSGTVRSNTDPKAPRSRVLGYMVTGRGKTFVNWVEQETSEQHPGKGLYTAAYAGILDEDEVTGRFYDEEGKPKQFTLIR